MVQDCEAPMYPYPLVLCMEKLACLIARKKVQDDSCSDFSLVSCRRHFTFCQGKEFSSDFNVVCSECVDLRFLTVYFCI